MSEWYRQAADGRITLTLHIQPGAKKTEFAGLHGNALKIRLAAPPVDGKANEALVKFIAETLGIAKSAVTLKSGQTSRRKVVEIENPTRLDVKPKLLPAAQADCR